MANVPVSQIDRLCELPSDAARRKALQDLPRGLTMTYERILSRINQKDAEVQRLVRRTLNWLYFQQRPLETGELSQAVAINVGDVHINVEAIPDVSDILHHCSSLVRKSADGLGVEFAHFTVKEFLSQLDSTKHCDFAAFVMSADYVDNELAMICLTYINMQDFDKYEGSMKTLIAFGKRSTLLQFMPTASGHLTCKIGKMPGFLSSSKSYFIRQNRVH